MAMKIREYKQIKLTDVTVAQGQTVSVKLPSQMAWVALQFRLASTLTLGTGTQANLQLDPIQNQIARLQLRANGRPIFELPFADQFFRHNYQQQTAGQLTNIAATGTAFNVGMHIPLSLPYPSFYPQRHATIFPAGLINNIELLITGAASFGQAALFNAGTATVANTLSVSALAIDYDTAELTDIINKAGHGYIQTQTLQNITAAGNLDLELTGGRGVLKDIYCRTIDGAGTGAQAGAAQTASNTFATTQRLLVGNNEFPVDSAFLDLRDESKRMYKVETNPTGTWMIAFNPDGEASHGIPLVGKPSFKLRSTYAAPSGGTSNISVIQGLVDPLFYRMML